MFDWLFASPAERRLLGQQKLRGPTPWVIAIMSFSILIIAATGIALANTAGVLTRAIQARYAVEVPNGGGDLARITKVVRRSPGVTSAEAVSESDMRKTLERWLGPAAASSSDLPVPALVNFDASGGANLRAIEQRVRMVAPDARIVAHRETIRPLLHSLRLLLWVAFGLVMMLSGAASAAVVLAARGALDTHRSTIEVLHGIGATDVQVTRLFQRRIAIDALVGSVAGAAAAAVVLLLLTAGASFAGELTSGATLSGVDLAILALLPLALTCLATWVARTAVLAALRQAL
jgi:cell division transport system permease protein